MDIVQESQRQLDGTAGGPKDAWKAHGEGLRVKYPCDTIGASVKAISRYGCNALLMNFGASRSVFVSFLSAPRFGVMLGESLITSVSLVSEDLVRAG